jgi:hypothetical protein
MVAKVVRSKSKVAEVIVLALGLFGCLAPASAAQQPASPKRKRAAVKPPEVLISPVQPSVEVLAAPRPLTPEQMPPVVPQVSWDGEQLSISAENSTLGSILEAVKQTLGTEIDVPAAASGERIVVHLGPGPAREVLSSLLTATSFDYIIQAADDNPQSVQSILLTPRSKPGSAGNDVRSAILASEPRRRFAPMVPSRPEPAAVEESSPNAQQPSVPPQTAADPAAGATPNAQPASTVANATPSTTDPNAPAQPQPVTPDAKQASTDAQNTSNGAVAIQADLTPAAAPADADNKQPVNMREQKVLEMENLFEQRKRMQEQALKANQSN